MTETYRTRIPVTPVVPDVPDSLAIEENLLGRHHEGEYLALPLSAFTPTALKEIGKQYTDALLARAEEMRNGEVEH